MPSIAFQSVLTACEATHCISREENEITVLKDQI
jgi:hypothetical protein